MALGLECDGGCLGQDVIVRYASTAAYGGTAMYILYNSSSSSSI
jgi:hypothetical protein